MGKVLVFPSKRDLNRINMIIRGYDHYWNFHKTLVRGCPICAAPEGR